MRGYFLLVTVFFLAMSFSGHAQRNKKLQYRADKLEFMKVDGEQMRKLMDNVVFTQKTTTIYCDSSYFYPKENRMEAFGRVRIVDDTVVITSRKLTYDGENRKALLRENVIYKNGHQTLYTDFLNYNLETRVGEFFNGGKLVDATNTLTSKVGIYYSQQEYAVFRRDVVLVSPEYTLKSDTLNYNTTTKIAVTPGPTEIITPDGVKLDALGGEYLTESKITEFISGEVETQDYILEGDELFLNDLEQYYTAKGNVHLTAKARDVIIIGDEGLYFKAQGISKIYGNPVMKKMMQQDTFYLSADTLYAIESPVREKKRILAYHNVKIFKSDLQGRADSIAYFLADSSIQLYDDPVLWANYSQITADSIGIQLVNNLIDQMLLRKNSFIVSEDSMRQFNQIKGRNMVAKFDSSRIDNIDVKGNGESIYYLLDEGDSILMGLNKMICSDMKIRFGADNELSNITFFKDPEARLIPPHEIKFEDTRLDGFAWREVERPELYDVAYYLKPEGYKKKPLIELKEVDPSIRPKLQPKKKPPATDKEAKAGGN